MNNYLAGFLAHLRLTPSHSKTNSGKKNVNQQQRGIQLQEQHPIFTGFPFKHFPKTSESNTKSGNKDIKENQTIKKFIRSIIINTLVYSNKTSSIKVSLYIKVISKMDFRLKLFGLVGKIEYI